jgi:hypothetical protein
MLPEPLRRTLQLPIGDYSGSYLHRNLAPALACPSFRILPSLGGWTYHSESPAVLFGFDFLFRGFFAHRRSARESETSRSTNLGGFWICRLQLFLLENSKDCAIIKYDRW